MSHKVFSEWSYGEVGASLEMKAPHCVGYPLRRVAVLSELSCCEKGPAIMDASFLLAGFARSVAYLKNESPFCSSSLFRGRWFWDEDLNTVSSSTLEA